MKSSEHDVLWLLLAFSSYMFLSLFCFVGCMTRTCNLSVCDVLHLFDYLATDLLAEICAIFKTIISGKAPD